jgi:hypothetical protein
LASSGVFSLQLGRDLPDCALQVPRPLGGLLRCQRGLPQSVRDTGLAFDLVDGVVCRR